MVIDDPIERSPALAALEVLSLCRGSDPVAVRAHSDSVDVLVIWSAPHLLVIDQNQHRVYGQLFDLHGTMLPSDYARLERRLPTQHRVAEWFGVGADPEEATRLMSSVGLSSPF